MHVFPCFPFICFAVSLSVLCSCQWSGGMFFEELVLSLEREVVLVQLDCLFYRREVYV